jgi:extracellular elastinolytic metalloproteinase
MKTLFSTIFIFLLGILPIFAQQKIANSNEIYDYLRDSKRQVNLADLENLKNLGSFSSKNSEITYNYFKQTYNGIPIFNSHISVAMKNNQIVSVQSNFIEGIQQLQLKNAVGINTSQIEQVAATNLGYTLIQHEQTEKEHNHQLGFRDFPEPKLVYYQKDNELILSYEMLIHVQTDDKPQILHLVASVLDGSILHSFNTMLECKFDHDSFSNTERESRKEILSQQELEGTNANTFLEDSRYQVFPLPVESPLFGVRSLDENPYHPEYSPTGWHRWDFTNESFTLTKGNNAAVMHDIDSQKLEEWANTGGITESGYVDGGSNYHFDFPLNLDLHPYDNKEASTTNVFYHINVLHDIFYHYGFDEAAGNFQFDNLGHEGADFDGVVVLTQTGERLGELNNALIYSWTDGSQPLILFFICRPAYLIGSPSIDLLEVVTEGPAQGVYKGMMGAFGPIPSDLSAELVILQDTNSVGNDSYDGCDPAINAADVEGKIALVKRGTCPYVQKVLNAQAAGAAAVVIVNNVPGPIQEGMGGIDPTIIIPSTIISKEDGELIIASLENGVLEGSMPAEGVNVLSMVRDSSLDNAVVAHEFGHGVSSRLTGGANNVCLENLEQMGEGWSDFFGSLLTIEPGDLGTDARGMSNYFGGGEADGNGIRPTPYSTDMSINPSTFATLSTYNNEESPHRLGYVWASMLWDMTWKLIDKYGFNSNIYASTGGNNIALNLVMEGLKLQPCSPGFVDGRDAILLADEILYEGSNKCEIWKAFSRRGLGYNADQGSVDNRLDGIANFDMPPVDVLDCTHMSVSDFSMNLAQVYPNPTSGIVHITTTEKESQVAIQLLDLSGKLVQTQSVRMNGNSGTLDISDKPVGVYVLKVMTPKGSQSFKLIKK